MLVFKKIPKLSEHVKNCQTLSDTKNNPERVELTFIIHRQTLDYMGLIFERLSEYPPTPYFVNQIPTNTSTNTHKNKN